MTRIETRSAKSLPGDSSFSRSFIFTRAFRVPFEKVATKRSRRKTKMIVESSRLYGLPKVSFIKLFNKSLKLLLIN